MNDVKRGMCFEHARQITGSPKAGTAKPVVMVITRTSGSSVWYRPEGTTGAGFVIDREKLGSIVGRWLDVAAVAR